MAVPVVGSGGAGPNDYRDKFHLPTGAKGLKEDNLDKRGNRPPPEGATLNACKSLVWRGPRPSPSRGCPTPTRRALSAQGPLPRRLHHDRRNAETDGGAGRECEERDPHGVIPRSAISSPVMVSGAGIQRAD